ncbi:MAG: hypothetical protein HY906_12575 [Deltaproteobacteria bacterium]|nr:hypothetical protein [Deltaproteobacteria bacterium]
MRGVTRVAAALAVAACCAGCPAQAVAPDDAAPQPDAGQEDVALDVLPPDDAPPDVPEQTDACPNESPENNCSDGCDNDGDGFTDLDDPDCVTAFLITREPPDGVLRWRVGDPGPVALHPGSSVVRPLVDAVQLAGAGFAVRRGMAPARGLYRFDPRPDPAPGPTLLFDVGFQASDVCVFAGRVVVTESGGPRLHEYDPAATVPDGGVVAPLRSATLTRGTLVRACAADATDLFAVVGVPDQPDDIVRLDADLNELGWPGLPTGLAADEKRLLDLAWDRRGSQFYGLFVKQFPPDGGPDAGTESNTLEVTPFVMGGAVGTPVTAPFALSTLSTFAP